MTRVAINGLGRIGRLLLRQHMDDPSDEIDIVAVNDLASADELAYLIKYDSVHGRARFPIEARNDTLRPGDKSIQVLAQKNPILLPWKELGVEVVIECTGRFTARDMAARHLEAGARRVLISAPAKDADLTIVLGVNEHEFNPGEHQVISNASCTTNSLAPALKVLLDNFGLDSVLVTTVHAYTATQSIVDTPTGKKQLGRAAAVNLIPTSTGADIATVSVLPVLKDRIRAIAIRVPVPDGAITDISANLKKSVTVEEINAAFRSAAEGPMRGILGYSEEELASTDILGDPHSGILHATSTRVVQGKMIKVQVWYDNEYGYVRRLLDVVERLPL